MNDMAMDLGNDYANKLKWQEGFSPLQLNSGSLGELEAAARGASAGKQPVKGATGGAPTGTAGTAGAAPAAAATDPNKKKGLSDKEYFSITGYDQKRGMPVLPDTTSYTTRPTVPIGLSDTNITPSGDAEGMTPEEELESRTFGLSNTGAALNWVDIPTPVRGPQGTFQGRDMDNALGLLQAEYARNMGTYRPKTEEEIQQQAALDYESYYDQLRRAAGNEYAMNDLAYQQQRNALQGSYDKSREASAKEYAKAYSQADRYLLQRGMQRSSYGGQTLANLAQQGAEAQQAIWDAQIAAEMDIDQRRQQLASNYANTMYGYDAGQASDIMSRVWDLRDTEYDRNVTRANTLNQLATQLYSYLNALNQADREQYNVETNLRENQHQFDTGVAQSRQAVEDARTQYQANLAEEMRQYNNTANMQELNFRTQYPQVGFTRAEDGRLVFNESQTNSWSQQYADLQAAYQEALNRPQNVIIKTGPDYGEQVAMAKSAELVAAKKPASTGKTTTPSGSTVVTGTGNGGSSMPTAAGVRNAVSGTGYVNRYDSHGAVLYNSNGGVSTNGGGSANIVNRPLKGN